LKKPGNEIDQFIYKVCYKPMWEAVNTYINQHLYALDLTYSRIKYPDSALVEDMMLESSRNIRVAGDSLLFDAAVSCTIDLTQDNDNGYATHDIKQWLLISCEAVITSKLESLTVTDVRPYSRSQGHTSDGHAVSKNIVPIIYKKDLDSEATAFLLEYFPEALEKPIRVPIADIAKKMGLDVIQGNRITDDFSIFGEICFSEGTVEVWDLFKCKHSKLDVKRGTILIDAYTYWERNRGCINNTIAHEVFHWYRHRMYAAIKDILRNEKVIACRCPADIVYPKENEEWTDEQRMEWQANSIAPRILMPIETFRQKVDELYRKYRVAEMDGTVDAAVITCVADELADFYDVSRQSALIRMKEAGYSEASSMLNQIDGVQQSFSIGNQEGFLEYIHNERFRDLIDSGLFRFVNGYFVIDDPRYIEKDETGRLALTEYAWDNLDSCTIRFTMKPARFKKDLEFPGLIMHRSEGFDKLPQLDEENYQEIIRRAREAKAKRQESFQLQMETLRILAPEKSCCQMLKDLFEARHLTKYEFEKITLLGPEVYSKVLNDNLKNPTTRTIVAIACGLDLDLDATERIMKAAGRSFTYSDEDRALKYCVTVYIGHPIEEINDFLEENGIEPLGTKQRK